MKEIVFGFNPKVAIVNYNQNNKIITLKIFNGKECEIGADNINSSNFEDELCEIDFTSKENIKKLYNIIDVNTTISILDQEVQLIFTNNKKSVEGVKKWLLSMIETLDRYNG